VPLVVVIGMLVSLVIGLPALRIRGLYLGVVTLAFSLAAESYLFRQDWLGGTSAGLQLDGPKLGPFDLDAIDGQGLMAFALVCLLLSVWVARNISGTATGRGFFALRENEKAAATLGIRLTRYKLLAFAVSGGIAALAGCIYGLNQGVVQAASFPTATSIVLVAMVVIGGLGSVEGSILGALVVFGLPDLLEFQNRWIIPIGTGVLLFNVITRAPGGLAGLLQLSRKELVTDLVELQHADRATARPSAGPRVAVGAAAGR
jgi:branched-chain amino acid transport system permease protein